MKHLSIILAGCILTFIFPQPNVTACTSFQLNHSGQIFVGKNYDWMVPDGLIMVNKRGVKKTAMSWSDDNPDIGTPAGWTAKYGSITFNQYGRELPAGGMNEKGLVIESMGLFGQGKFPAPDERPSILMQQWIQYQLDNSATVKEVVDSDAFVRIRPKKGVRIHYLVSDNQGNCAAVEFVEGKMAAHFNEYMPHKVFTNSYYTESVEFFKQNKLPDPDRYKSIERFIRASTLVGSYEPDSATPPLDFAFTILKSVMWSISGERNGVSYTSNTRWSIIYDSNELVIYFKTFDNREIRFVKMGGLDFSCTTPAKVFDINTKTSGDVTGKFVDYTRKAHRNLVENAYDKTVYLPKFPPEFYDRLSRYPDSLSCEE